MIDPRIASGRDMVWKASVIPSEIRSSAELNCACLVLHPSHQRDTAHRPIGTGRLHARRRFGYWGEQIGHLRGQSGHHFGACRQNSIKGCLRADRNRRRVLDAAADRANCGLRRRRPPESVNTPAPATTAIHTLDTAIITAADTIAGYIQGLLDGIEFKQTAYALDRDSRKAALARFLKRASGSDQEAAEEERRLAA
jgi:hypothetical protein